MTEREIKISSVYKFRFKVGKEILFFNGKVTEVRGFKTAEDAHKAYVELKRKMHVGNTI